MKTKLDQSKEIHYPVTGMKIGGSPQNGRHDCWGKSSIKTPPGPETHQGGEISKKNKVLGGTPCTREAKSE